MRVIPLAYNEIELRKLTDKVFDFIEEKLIFENRCGTLDQYLKKIGFEENEKDDLIILKIVLAFT